MNERNDSLHEALAQQRLDLERAALYGQQLLGEIEELKQTLSNKEGELATAKLEIESLTEQLEGKDQRHASLQKDYAVLSQLLSESDKAQETQDKKEGNHARRQGYAAKVHSKRLEELEAEIDKLRVDLQTERASTLRLKAEKISLQAEVAASQTLVLDMESLRARATTAETAQAAQQLALQTEARLHRAKITEMESAHRSAMDAVDSQFQALQAAHRTELSQLATTIASLRTANRQLAAHAEDLAVTRFGTPDPIVLQSRLGSLHDELAQFDPRQAAAGAPEIGDGVLEGKDKAGAGAGAGAGARSVIDTKAGLPIVPHGDAHCCTETASVCDSGLGNSSPASTAPSLAHIPARDTALVSALLLTARFRQQLRAMRRGHLAAMAEARARATRAAHQCHVMQGRLDRYVQSTRRHLNVCPLFNSGVQKGEENEASDPTEETSEHEECIAPSAGLPTAFKQTCEQETQTAPFEAPATAVAAAPAPVVSSAPTSSTPAPTTACASTQTLVVLAVDSPELLRHQRDEMVARCRHAESIAVARAHRMGTLEARVRSMEESQAAEQKVRAELGLASHTAVDALRVLAARAATPTPPSTPPPTLAAKIAIPAGPAEAPPTPPAPRTSSSSNIIGFGSGSCGGMGFSPQRTSLSASGTAGCSLTASSPLGPGGARNATEISLAAERGRARELDTRVRQLEREVERLVRERAALVARVARSEGTSRPAGENPH